MSIESILIANAGSIFSSILGLFGSDGAAEAAQRQAIENTKQRTFQASENQRTRALSSQQKGLQVQRQSAQDRAQALDRIIRQFQQTLRR